MSSPTLIIVADDWGLSPAVDAGILETVRCGAVTTVDAFVNPPCTADPQPVAAAGATLGLHLNLTHGRPCSAASDVRSLTTAAGQFLRREELLVQADMAEVAREWQRQLAHFRERVGRLPCHVSVHKHLHRDDARLLALAAEVARECGAPLRTLHPAMRDACRALGALTTDGFLGDVRPAPYWTLARLREQIEAVPAGITELMCHPGKDVQPIEGMSYLAERDVERQTFCAPEARTLFAKFKLAPCSAALFGSGA